MIEFMKPAVEIEEINDCLSRFVVEPLERGYGDTLGNTLRRVMLNSLTGARATAISIDDVQHEFSTAMGVVEDITDVVLNIKGLVFKINSEEGTPEFNQLVAQEQFQTIASIEVEGPATVTGNDIKIPAQFDLVNKDHVIAHVAEGGALNMDIRIGVGRGRVQADQNKRDEDPIGCIAVDSNFSPVKRCAMKKENTRVGQHTDYDRLTLEVETDGSITPTEAVNRAAFIVNQHMNAFLELIKENEAKKEATIFGPEIQEENIELNKTIDDLDLTVRSYNCLKNAKIMNIRQLVEFSEHDLLNIRNFGSKSIDEVKAKLASMNLSLRQDI